MADIQKALRKKDRRKTRNYQLKGLYGITMDDYDKMYKKQNGCCEICSKRFEKLFIDHSHVTNKVRGLLCGACNKMIGFAKENTVTLVNAIQYINKHSGVGVQNITTSKAG